MRIRLSAVAVVVLSMLCTRAAVWGQQSRSLFGGGSTLGRSVTGGTRSFAGGTGQTQQPATGAAGEVQTALQQMVGDFVSSGARFSRDTRQSGQFVGADTSEMQTFVGSVQAGQNVSGQMRSGLQSGSGLRSGSGLTPGGQTRRGTTNRSGAARGGGRTTTEIRTSLSLGFRRPVAASSAVSTALVRRLSRSRRIRTVSPVEILVQGRTATLRGVVATDYDRALAEQLARLDVGIWRVNNELAVAAAPAEPEVPPPGEPVLEPPPPGAP